MSPVCRFFCAQILVIQINFLYDEDEDGVGYVTEFSQLSFPILVCGLSWLYLIKLAPTSLRREILSKLPGKEGEF